MNDDNMYELTLHTHIAIRNTHVHIIQQTDRHTDH